MAKKYPTSKSWKWKFLTFGALKWDKAVTNKLFTDVDLMSLFDKVLLHEVLAFTDMEAVIMLTKLYRCAILLLLMT